ncbi:MAG: S8 family serine peptidase [Candidatus Melainabacteria bacterium]|nr:S8 family serine peptidase [Candidatus Melainabacteria bacterium]
MIIRFVILISFVFGSYFFTQVKAQDENLSQPIPGQYIVKFKDSNEDSSQKADKLATVYGAMVQNVYEHAIMGASVNIPPGKEQDVANDPDVEQLVQDFTVYAVGKPSDIDDNSMIDGNAMATGNMSGGTVQVIPTGINWVDAELNTTNEGEGVTVAVLDTGIDFNHPDLMVNKLLSRDFSGDNTGGNDDNRSIGGHGTHCAGVIAALDNTTGVLGVGSKIDLVSVKVLGASGSGSFSGIIAGLDYVTANAATIAVTNSSFGARGGTSPSQSFIDSSNLLHQAYQRAVNAGVICVVAAGNDAVDVTSNNEVPAMYPEVVTVSAVDDRNGVQDSADVWAYFSNFGPEVDIIAPGVNILSTAIGGGTSSLSGTSFSSPHVAGTVALYVAKNGRPASGDARLLSSLISAISKSRSPLPGEPSDGFTEPSCYANGSGLQ